MEDVLTTTGYAIALKNMNAYFETHDVRYVADDAVFINMGTGERTEGREAIGKMLDYFYHIAFDARAEFINSIITEKKAMVEGLFVGKHIGEFAGLPATYKTVSVPLCVTYNIENGLIQEARIYMLTDVLMQQLRG